ncbi:unnamed protein product, partial [Brenthis ino]
MLRELVAFVATLCLYKAVHAQPAHCEFDVQCQNNYYCVPDAFVCRRCLECEQLKRDPPHAPSSCVKSVAECGSCIKGLVEDRSDVSAECVSPSVDYSNTTTWVVVGLVIVFVVVVIVIGVYLVRNIDPKISASTSLQRAFNIGTRAPRGAPPSAPAGPPPPYYEAPSAAAASPPPDNPAYLIDYEPHSGEDSHPFIKRAPSTRPPDAREAAGSQAAYMYNKPHYVRGPHLPSDGEAGAGQAAPRDADRDALAHDEDTMESTWSPDLNGNAVGGGADVAGAAGGAGGAAGGGAAAATWPRCWRRRARPRRCAPGRIPTIIEMVRNQSVRAMEACRPSSST